jgi:phosphate-selective porin OprO/OprP
MGTAMVGGLLQADFASFAGDKTDVARTSGDIRRGNIWIKGNLDKDWSYQLGYDARFTRLDTSWVGYAGFEPFWLAIGLIDSPQSLEVWSGPVNSTFMEYASVIQAFQPPRGIGLYADGSIAKNILSYQAAIYVPNYQTADVLTDGYAYSQGIMVQDGGFGTESDPWGAALRVTLNQENLLGLKERTHFGASIRYEGVSSSETINPFVATPGMLGKANGVRNNITVASMTPLEGAVKSVNVYGLEAAGIWGPFMLQGEYIKNHVNGREGNSSPSYLGYYGQATYVLTGERRTYDQYTGTVGSVSHIQNPYGAWEVAFRYGFVDLNDDPDVGYIDETLKRGKQTDYTIGLNWYVKDNVRFLGNYTVAQADYAYSTGRGDESIKGMGVRAQVDF